MTVPDHIASENLRALFAAKAVARGGVVRRNILWADAQIGRERLLGEVRRRGFHILRCGGQYVIVCNPGPIELVF